MAKGAISGFYFRVIEEGEVSAGDDVRLLERRSEVSVAEVMRVTYRDRADRPALDAVIAVPELAERWRNTLVVVAGRQALPVRELGA